MPRTVVYLRFARHRNGFQDPETVVWDLKKERELWKMLRSTSTDFEWQHLAEHFSVPLVYILQQAAWLYEKELGSLRRRMSLMTQSNIITTSNLVSNDQLQITVREPAAPTLAFTQRERNDQDIISRIKLNGKSNSEADFAPETYSDADEKPKRRLLSASRITSSDNDSDIGDTSLDGFILPQKSVSPLIQTHLSSSDPSESTTSEAKRINDEPLSPKSSVDNILNKSVDSVSSDSTVSQSAMEAALIAQDNHNVSESE